MSAVGDDPACIFGASLLTARVRCFASGFDLDRVAALSDELVILVAQPEFSIEIGNPIAIFDLHSFPADIGCIRQIGQSSAEVASWKMNGFRVRAKWRAPE
ncbi:hypothetical protein [Bradyrhizobium sp. BR13661]|uniref:hypothetical protein n=1 Tax=Bradyrhizobium sp. BR13661 TaxID=2940622 RepID=UPI002475A29A|nr:hypothetical protein [Bradyrhizobium sp. BR13661]MDH6260860.1 hypothetical protein [Bradyrhizobium sp. BR13661]